MPDSVDAIPTPTMPIVVRAVCLLILTAMSILIAYGCFYQNEPGQVAASMVPFWGKFVWTDVTATFLLFSTFIFTYERSPLAGLAMLVLMNLFGAAAIATWLLWRGPDLYRRIRIERSRSPNCRDAASVL